MKKTEIKKSSAKKKLIPATCMLLVSATMLASSTYAWFTMSREVEVTGLKMTATVPEDLQISLGTIGTAPSTPETAEGGKSLGTNNGVLTYTSGASASDGNVAAPTHTWDWSNSADISAYYAFGRLIPASSSTGENVFYTPDATGVGKTVDSEGSYYQAAAANVAYGTNFAVDGNTSTITYSAAAANATSARATLHAFTDENDGSNDTWTDAATDSDYKQAVDWKNTNDDGYYVDVPVWIRTSSNSAVGLTVDGYVLPGSEWVDGTKTKKQTELELYRAVRVAILDGETKIADNNTGRVASTIGTPANSTGSILPLKDAWNVATDGATAVSSADQVTHGYAAVTPFANKYSGSSILDSANLGTSGRVFYDSTPAAITYDSSKYYGVSASATVASTGADTVTKYYKGTYAEYTPYDATNATLATKTITTIPGSTTSGNYGEAKKLIIRVWLDGEDGECWNDNAGQDWVISLKFSKV